MSRFSIKNIMLGIGIGIVFMSIVSLIYLAGSDPGRNLTEEDLARIADRYGLIKRTEVIDNTSGVLTSETTGAAETTNSSSSVSGTTATAATGTTKTGSTTAGTATAGTAASGGNVQEVLFVIKSGETSEQIAASLYKNDLITNEADFIDLLDKKGMEDNIQAGEFKINKKTDMNEIIRIITR